MGAFVRNTVSSSASVDALYSVDQAFRSALQEGVRRSRLSRAEIARRMSGILGTDITLNVINNWLAPSREVSRMPACFVPAFARATGNDVVLRFLLGRDLVNLLRLGELTSRCVPGALSRFEKSSERTESRCSRSSSEQETLFV